MHLFYLFSSNLLSFVGNGFFSSVVVFFNFDLSKVDTSLTSGLSLILLVLKIEMHKHDKVMKVFKAR